MFYSTGNVVEFLEHVPDAVESRLELSAFDDEELTGIATGVEELRRRLDSWSVQVLGELEVRSTTDTRHGMRTGPWLAREAMLPVGPAKARVKTASKLRSHLDVVLDALIEGRIGWDHTKVLADAANPRIITQWAEVAGDLIDLACSGMTFNTWKRHVLALAELLDEDGGHKPGDDITDNTLHLSPGYQGTLQLQGQLAGEQALIASEIIETRANEIFYRLRKDAELSCMDLAVPPRPTLLALALIELLREATATTLDSSKPPRPEVSLIINASDPEHVTNNAGIPVGDTTASTLLCDCVFQPIVMNTEGIVTNLGRRQRLASPAQRKALAHRDGGCVWPGCDNPAEWTDAHHTRHWRSGGNTDLADLASLCRYHHGVTHRKNWQMHAAPDQWFWWQTPTGDTFWSQRHGQQRQGPTPQTVPRTSRTNSREPGGTRQPEPPPLAVT